MVCLHGLFAFSRAHHGHVYTRMQLTNEIKSTLDQRDVSSATALTGAGCCCAAAVIVGRKTWEYRGRGVCQIKRMGTRPANSRKTCGVYCRTGPRTRTSNSSTKSSPRWSEENDVSCCLCCCTGGFSSCTFAQDSLFKGASD
jgi:hypothetical protein